MVYHVNAHASVAHPLKRVNSLQKLISVVAIQILPDFNLCNVGVCVLGRGGQRQRVCPCATLTCVEIIFQQPPTPFPEIPA